jgi:hypothetical protein
MSDHPRLMCMALMWATVKGLPSGVSVQWIEMRWMGKLGADH